MSPLVTFAIPVYNALSTLPQCVSSILSQSAADFELLLVDDGSTDGSAQLCDQLALQDARVCSLHKENGGASSARNLAIQKARGQWLLFVDADDGICADYLEVILEQASRHPHSMFLWDSTTQTDQLHQPGSAVEWQTHSPNQLAWLYNHDLVGAVWNTLLNVDVLRENSLLFDPSLILGEDLPFVFAYAQALFSRWPEGDIRSTRAPLYFYRDSGPASLSRQFPPNFCQGWCITFQRVLDVCDEFLHPCDADLYGIAYNYMRTIGVGLRAVLRDSQLSPAQRRKKVRGILQSTSVRQLCARFKAQHWFSPYYWPFRLGWLWAIRLLGDWNEQTPARYFQCYWLGYGVHRQIWPQSPSI